MFTREIQQCIKIRNRFEINPGRAFWGDLPFAAVQQFESLPHRPLGGHAKGLTGMTESPADGSRGPISCGGLPDGTDIGSTWMTRMAEIRVPSGHGFRPS